MASNKLMTKHVGKDLSVKIVLYKTTNGYKVIHYILTNGKWKSVSKVEVTDYSDALTIMNPNSY